MIHTGDLMECIDWLGKTSVDLGVKATPESPIEKIEGTLFDHKAKGYLNFEKIKGGRALPLISVELLVTGMEFKECRDLLTEMYGKYKENGTTPNDRVYGGAVIWYKFDAGRAEVTLKLAQGKKLLGVDFRMRESNV